jgi:hypothetical protein
MTTTFKILFTVELLHDFYKEGICTDFKLIASEATKELLANCNAMYKTVGNQLVVLIKADSNNKPFIAPDKKAKFTFYMELMKPLFMTVSSLDLEALAGKRFYFSNLAQNKLTIVPGIDELFVSNVIKPYDAAATYGTGDFVTHNDITYELAKQGVVDVPSDASTVWVSRKQHPYANKLIPAYEAARTYHTSDFVIANDVIFECTADAAAGNKPTEGSAFWALRTKNQFASSKDLIQLVAKQSSFPVAPGAAAVQIEVYQLNLVNNLFEELVWKDTQYFEEPVTSVAVDLSKQLDARYKVLINGNVFDVYASNDAVYKNMFGVLDFYNHLPNGNDFAFFDAAGKLKDRLVVNKNLWLNYTIRFANKLAFWKYLVPQKGIDVIETVPAGQFAGNAVPADFFTSKQMIPLQEKPQKFKLKLFQPISSEPPLAPNPDVQASGMLTKNGADYYCNIYLNY